MIKTFKNKDTEKIWNGLKVKSIPLSIQNRALCKLRLLYASQTLNDLKSPPGNRLDPLKGDRIGQMSVRINNQWRICFVWEDNEAYEVEIIDYH